MTINQIATMSSAYRSLYVNQTSAAKSLQRISTGYRINSAADDAAGLAISEKMRGQISGLSMASQNAQQGITMIQSAEGSLDSTSEIIRRMQDLAVQASNGTYSDSDRKLLDQEFQQLKGALDGVASSANYNGINLLDGSLGGKVGSAGIADLGISSITAGGSGTLSGTAKINITQENGVYSITAQIGEETYTQELAAIDTSATFNFDGGNTLTVNFGAVSNLSEGVITNVGVDSNAVDTSKAISADANSQLYLQIGANGTADQRMGLHINDMTSVGLGIHDLSIDSLTGANDALGALNDALGQVNRERANLGATQNRLEHTISNLGVTRENLVASESRIRDADIAKEMMNYTQRTIQAQAAQAMMAQSMNLSRHYMLGLLLR